jgi:drug/metabolite transporter (DMT)-like permease
VSPFVTLVWLMNLLADTIGQLSFKAASRGADHLDGLAHWRSLLVQPLLWLGLAAFASEFLLWLALLSLIPLSQAVLVGCINIIGVMVGGRLFFGERLTLPRTSALVLIAVGVGLVGWGGA